MSSPEMQRGLLANCVAARVDNLGDPEHRKLIWWLQKASWQPGGLEQIAKEIIRRWPARFTTRAMQQLGCEPGRVYSDEEAANVFKEMPSHWSVFDIARARGEAPKLPASRRVHEFSDQCRQAAERDLATFLFQELCLNPAWRHELWNRALWYFPMLGECLSELCAIESGESAKALPLTTIGAEIHETLEFALCERGLVVVDGVARIGKTWSVKAWCDARPGQARYVQVPSSNDDLSFFRAICGSLGLGAGLNFKALELRAKIEAVLQGGDLMLVLDEGHYLWPQRNMRKAVPHRINWMLTQLVNMGVPVAVVTTPQFTKSQAALVASGGWSSEQLIGRIMDYKRLPDVLSEDDLLAVARYWLPYGCDDSIELLVRYAQSSEKYLQGIESLVKRARRFTTQADRETVTFADIGRALESGVVPSDNSLRAAMEATRPARRQPVRRPIAEPLQADAPAASRASKPLASQQAFSAPARDAGVSVLST